MWPTNPWEQVRILLLIVFDLIAVVFIGAYSLELAERRQSKRRENDAKYAAGRVCPHCSNPVASVSVDSHNA